MLGEDPCVVFGDSVFLYHAGAAHFGLLRKESLPFRNLLFSKRDRNEIRLREIAVVVRVLLGAHRRRLHRIAVPTTRLLDNRDGMDHALPLTARLVFERGMNSLEGVHVLDLDLRPELLRTDRTDGDVDVGTHIALFQVTVGHARVHKNLLEGGQVGNRFVCARDVRLGHDLHQRSPAAIEVDA